MDIENNTTRYLVRFRAFGRENKSLYTWDMLEGYPLKDIDATFPQEYTGVCDKNLQDVYVGDIVNYNSENYLVRFQFGSYILYKLENISTLNFYCFHTDFDKYCKMEIVGNTFQNS